MFDVTAFGFGFVDVSTNYNVRNNHARKTNTFSGLFYALKNKKKQGKAEKQKNR